MSNKHGHGKHMILMLLCCLIPVILIFALRFFNIGGGSSWIVFLLCPLMHIFMMKGMLGGHGKDSDNDCHGANKNNSN